MDFESGIPKFPSKGGIFWGGAHLEIFCTLKNTDAGLNRCLLGTGRAETPDAKFRYQSQLLIRKREFIIYLSRSVPVFRRFGGGGFECARWRFRSFPRVMYPIPWHFALGHRLRIS